MRHVYAWLSRRLWACADRATRLAEWLDTRRAKDEEEPRP